MFCRDDSAARVNFYSTMESIRLDFIQENGWIDHDSASYADSNRGSNPCAGQLAIFYNLAIVKVDAVAGICSDAGPNSERVAALEGLVSGELSFAGIAPQCV